MYINSPIGQLSQKLDVCQHAVPVFPAVFAETAYIGAAKPNIKKQPWPKGLPEWIAAVRSELNTAAGPMHSDDVAGRFTRARKTDVGELLETLATLGHARQTEDGRFVG